MNSIRLVSWNTRRAKPASFAWEYLRELDPDVAVLQEVGGLPDDLRRAYSVRIGTPITKHGNPQQFSTALLVRGQIVSEVPLQADRPWINTLLAQFAGNILSYDIRPTNGPPHRIVNVYSPAWPIAREAYAGIDVSGVKLNQNPDLWASDLLTNGLAHSREGLADAWLVAGDFNSCVTFDGWRGGPRGNAEWLARMAKLGFVECLSGHNGRMVPTFKVPRRSEPTCQIDKVFATAAFTARLVGCSVGDGPRVLGAGLSDHLPVIADFLF